MEIGGFITEGAEIVNHDNTLSGNGTVDSPLSVVPGYNETVLYSSTGAILSAETTLSEPGSNFEKLEFWWGGIPGTTQTQYLVNDVVRPCDFIAFLHAAGGNNVWMQWGRLSANSDFSKIKMDKGKSFNYGAVTATAWVNPTCSTGVPDSFYCYKIVGINRINNA